MLNIIGLVTKDNFNEKVIDYRIWKKKKKHQALLVLQNRQI